MRKFLVTMLCCICFCFSIFNPTISVLAEDIEKFFPIDSKEFVNEDISTENITHNNELYSAEQTENTKHYFRDMYVGRRDIVITLKGGQTYKLRTLCYGYKADYYEFMIRKEATLLEVNGSSLNVNSTTVSYDAIWYKFTPSTTNYYSFYTVGSLDTYLELYSENFERYSFDDDGGTSLNACIDFYLFAGKTYYLKAHTLGMGSGTFKVYANMQRIVQIHPLSKTSQYTYTFGKNENNFFRFTPTITREYTFYTYLYEGDPYLHLYNNTMVLLESNDDGGDGYNALLTYKLEAGKTYYIRIRNFGNTAGYGYLYCTYD